VKTDTTRMGRGISATRCPQGAFDGRRRTTGNVERRRQAGPWIVHAMRRRTLPMPCAAGRSKDFSRACEGWNIRAAGLRRRGAFAKDRRDLRSVGPHCTGIGRAPRFPRPLRFSSGNLPDLQPCCHCRCGDARPPPGAAETPGVPYAGEPNSVRVLDVIRYAEMNIRWPHDQGAT